MLRRSDYEVEIHPQVPHTKKTPDLLARRDGVPQFYLEATLAMPPGDLAAEARLAELRDTLDRMDSPDFFLQIDYRGAPRVNISGRALRQQLECWLRQLVFDDIDRLCRDQNYEAIPSFTYSDHGVLLTFTPRPKGPMFRGQPGARPIGIVMPMEMHLLETHKDIRVAIEGKSAKYGALEFPLIVAINVLDDFCDDDDIWNALFGEEQIVIALQQNGELGNQQRRRLPNGAWWRRNSPRNTLASAVIITNQLSPSTLRSTAVEVIHNPWADHPLPQHSLSLPQRSISLPDGHVHCIGGIHPADILGVPADWPLADR